MSWEFLEEEDEAMDDADNTPSEPASGRILSDEGVTFTTGAGALEAGDDNNIEDADAEVAAEIS